MSRKFRIFSPARCSRRTQGLSGETDTIGATRFTRRGRRATEAMALTDFLTRKCRCKLIFTTDGIDMSTTNDRLARTLMAGIAEWETSDDNEDDGAGAPIPLLPSGFRIDSTLSRRYDTVCIVVPAPGCPFPGRFAPSIPGWGYACQGRFRHHDKSLICLI
ncbi:recombinase family protein [bacterium]|nr:recombinase family protein [bacterium]